MIKTECSTQYIHCDKVFDDGVNDHQSQASFFRVYSTEMVNVNV